MGVKSIACRRRHTILRFRYGMLANLQHLWRMAFADYISPQRDQDYEEPLKLFGIIVGHILDFRLPFVAILP